MAATRTVVSHQARYLWGRRSGVAGREGVRDMWVGRCPLTCLAKQWQHCIQQVWRIKEARMDPLTSHPYRKCNKWCGSSAAAQRSRHPRRAVGVDDAARQRRLLPLLRHGVQAKELQNGWSLVALQSWRGTGRASRLPLALCELAAATYLVGQRRLLHDAGPPLHCSGALEQAAARGTVDAQRMG